MPPHIKSISMEYHSLHSSVRRCDSSDNHADRLRPGSDLTGVTGDKSGLIWIQARGAFVRVYLYLGNYQTWPELA